MQPVFRFAPSPNGLLHAGHAYSALLNDQLAREAGGRFLLRLEDIDTVRCTEDRIAACLEDLAWLGLTWEEPVLRQSQHFARYRAVAEELREQGLLYPCFCSRMEITRQAGATPPRDPDGAVLYPGTCRALSTSDRSERIAAGEPFALRLDMAEALKRSGVAAWTWHEQGEGLGGEGDPAIWGDVVLVRKECPTSYHLSVVLDDAVQGITHVVRGRDLFPATAIHRLLQTLLSLPVPSYRHHPLILDDHGRKLAKSMLSTPLRDLRIAGARAISLRERLGFRT